MGKIITVHVKLRGIETSHEVQALSLREGLYKILPTLDKYAEPDNWEFPPGSVVRISEQTNKGKSYFVARAKN